MSESEDQDDEPVKHKVRYPSGAVKKKYYRVNGKLDGTYKMYYEDGTVNIKADYDEGKRHGIRAANYKSTPNMRTA